MQFDSYPVTLFVEVYEIDDTVSELPDYEFVGAADIRIDGPGAYKKTLENDEGKVTIFFDMLETEPLVLEVATPRYLGVFERGYDEHTIAADLGGKGLSFDAFVDGVHANSRKGLKLVDVESWAGQGGRRYVGVFREGSQTTYFYGGLRGGMHQDVWEASNAEGYQIVDNDVYINEHTYHQSIFAQTGIESRYPNPQSMEDFLNDWSTFSSQGWRLTGVTMDPTYGPGYVRPTYSRGSGPTALWVTDSRTEFEAIWHNSVAQGLRLIDVETFPYGNRTAYISPNFLDRS